jgi:hypothetical protein
MESCTKCLPLARTRSWPKLHLKRNGNNLIYCAHTNAATENKNRLGLKGAQSKKETWFTNRTPAQSDQAPLVVAGSDGLPHCMILSTAPKRESKVSYHACKTRAGRESVKTCDFQASAQWLCRWPLLPPE